jgi:hypothetical protein
MVTQAGVCIIGGHETDAANNTDDPVTAPAGVTV